MLIILVQLGDESGENRDRADSEILARSKFWRDR